MVMEASCPKEPPLDRPVHLGEYLPDPLPPTGREKGHEPVDQRRWARDGVDGRYEDHDPEREDVRHAGADAGDRRERTAREEVARRIAQPLRVQTERGIEAEHVLHPHDGLLRALE